jgi:hypothetical protein
MRLRQLPLYLWASPSTLLGLLFAPEALWSGEVRIVDGVVEIHGRMVRFFLAHCTFLRGGASAMTLGHVVIGRDRNLLERTRQHERVHVRQYERWGPLFIPAYLTLSLFMRLRGLRAYEDNPFEREAFGEAAG